MSNANIYNRLMDAIGNTFGVCGLMGNIQTESNFKSTNMQNSYEARLGMNDTTFKNCHGIDEDGHVTSAYDIALMSRELLNNHPSITKYTTIWMDTLRDGKSELVNTNKLIRNYKGATGLKTGSTNKAKFCISATAERNGMHLICVIMGAPTSDVRNKIATKLLDWGFANYGLYTSPSGEANPVPVKGGVMNACSTSYDSFSCVLPKEKIKDVEQKIELLEFVHAPVKKGDVVGSVIYLSDGAEVGRGEIVASETIDKMDFFDILKRMLAAFLLI